VHDNGSVRKNLLVRKLPHGEDPGNKQRLRKDPIMLAKKESRTLLAAYTAARDCWSLYLTLKTELSSPLPARVTGSVSFYRMFHRMLATDVYVGGLAESEA
jgi:hypothetical protein